MVGTRVHLGAGLLIVVVLSHGGDDCQRQVTTPSAHADSSPDKSLQRCEIRRRARAKARAWTVEARSERDDAGALPWSQMPAPFSGEGLLQSDGYPWIGSTAQGGSNSGALRYAVFLPGVDSFAVHAAPFGSSSQHSRRIWIMEQPIGREAPPTPIERTEACAGTSILETAPSECVAACPPDRLLLRPSCNDEPAQPSREEQAP